MIKLTDLRGSENLPRNKKWISVEDEEIEAERGYCNQAYNAAVSQIEECGIEIDINEIERIIWKYCSPLYAEDIEGHTHTLKGHQVIRALAESANQWLKIKEKT